MPGHRSLAKFGEYETGRPCAWSWEGEELMSWNPAEDPKPGDEFTCEAIETVIVPRARDLGSFEVRRALPSAQRQML
jgi:hypothetical protein